MIRLFFLLAAVPFSLGVCGQDEPASGCPSMKTIIATMISWKSSQTELPPGVLTPARKRTMSNVMLSGEGRRYYANTATLSGEVKSE